MPQLTIGAFDTASGWATLAPDNATPSPELTLADDTTLAHFGADARSLRISGSVDAADHRARKTLPALDLRAFDELRLWLHSDRLADGTPARPFFLELRLGSDALAVDAPANTWQRYLPVTRAGEWELVRVNLRDLPAATRGAVSVIQLRCIDASAAFVCHVDDVLAVRAEMIGDVDAALLERLHERVSVGGVLVPALLYLPENPVQQAAPYIRITNYAIAYVDMNTSGATARGDFTGTSFQVYPRSLPYHLFYEIDVFADTRQHKTQVQEFVLQALPPNGRLVVNDTLAPIGWIAVPWQELIGGHVTDRAPLHYQVLTWQELGAPQVVTPPYRSVVLDVDQRVSV